MLAVIYFFSDSKNKQVCSLDNEYVVNNGPGVGRVTSIQLICPVNVFEAAIFRLFFFFSLQRWKVEVASRGIARLFRKVQRRSG